MNEREHILALTQIAFLNAIILSFLGLQFVMPPAFMLLLWIVPTIFALQAYYVSTKLTLLFGLVITVLSFVLLGVGTGFWAAVYFLAGNVLGTGRRHRYHWLPRVLSTSVTFALSLFAIMVVFAWLAQISWQDVNSLLVGLDSSNRLLFFPIMVVGLMVWAVVLSVAVDWLLSRVLLQLHIGLR